MLDTAKNADIEILSEDYCCKLLAWLYAFGGNNEAVVKNKKLASDISYAQERLKVNGGLTPKSGDLRKYLIVVEPFMRIPDACRYGYVIPVWAEEINKRYNIR